MSLKPSPLAGQLAGLRAATTANAERGWLPASLHALIMAIFAHIFGRLEQLLLLWQSATLPATANGTGAHAPARPSNRATPRVLIRARRRKLAAPPPPPPPRPAPGRMRDPGHPSAKLAPPNPPANPRRTRPTHQTTAKNPV